ncbi:MAG TPA: FAD-binding oxidoreductase [Chthonomonadaceae bacterium]|nr:FAD-binding oxidoreductase [Chthonomonadaceae bacterium]
MQLWTRLPLVTSLLKALNLSSRFSCGTYGQPDGSGAVIVNDIHSQLNATRVCEIACPDSLQALRSLLERARRTQRTVCIAGTRHAMGAQQFATDALLVDMTRLNRVLRFLPDKGLVEAEAGICWPDLVQYLLKVQKHSWPQWGIAQKQTGADRLTLGGALAANVHGRGLRMKPLISDIEAFTLLDAEGNLHACSRLENPELFRLVIGGYGLFGVVYSITLRLVPRQKVQRVVRVLPLEELMPAFEKRIAEGFVYGDFQYLTDETSDDFLFKGVFSCYHPVDPRTPIPEEQRQVSRRDWEHLVYLGHTDKAQAFRLYADYYLSTSGQVYWSDTHQLGAYLENYHRRVDRLMRASAPATEMISEIFVPRQALYRFMREVREDFRKPQVNVIYGTIRLIERDEESFLAWAKEAYACVIFNLHVTHTPQGLDHAASAFRRLIDLAIGYEGSYYLTYHKYATRDQVQACYPEFARFLQLKQRYDPEERFQSDWYRHYRPLFL